MVDYNNVSYGEIYLLAKAIFHGLKEMMVLALLWLKALDTIQVVFSISNFSKGNPLS